MAAQLRKGGDVGTQYRSAICGIGGTGIAWPAAVGAASRASA